MLIKTNLHSQDYRENEVCRIVNTRQHKLYTKNKIYPIDMYSSVDGSGNDIVVYIYKKEDTAEIYQKWLRKELN